MTELSPELQATLLGWAATIVKALLLLVGLWFFAGWARRASLRGFERMEFDRTLSRFFSSMLRWAILLLGGLSIVSVFGVEPASFAAVLAGAGLAIGMAFSGTLGNFAAGIMLLTFRPFKVDDVVSVAGVTGKVDEIGMFTTTMNTFDNRRLILPNGTVFGQTIENISFHETRRVEVSVGADYSADIDRTREVLESAVRAVPAVLEEPGPDVVLLELGASSVDWQVRAWARKEDHFSVKQATTRAVKKALDDAGIGIPFPQMDVHLDQLPEG